MATNLFAFTASTATDSGAVNSLAYPAGSQQGILGFSAITPGTNNLAANNGIIYSGFPFDRYVQSNGPQNGQTVVDVVFPRGRDNVAASYCVVYSMAAGALT